MGACLQARVRDASAIGRSRLCPRRCRVATDERDWRWLLGAFVLLADVPYHATNNQIMYTDIARPTPAR
jgi:hypothetical protein